MKEEVRKKSKNNTKGIVARAEIGQYLGPILQKINDYEPVQISSFASDENDGMLCLWSKVCFAYVCIDLGILTKHKFLQK